MLFFSNTITKEIDGTTTIRAKRQQRNEEFLIYNKRCLILRYAVVICSTVLLIPVTFIIMAIGIDIQWLFKALGVVIGSSVLPVVLAITWHRITSTGMMAGVLVGLPSALLSWLSYASSLDGGLTKFRENTNDSTVLPVCPAVFKGKLEHTKKIFNDIQRKQRDQNLLVCRVKIAPGMSVARDADGLGRALRSSPAHDVLYTLLGSR